LSDSLLLLLFLGNQLCKWIVMPVSSGCGGSSWLLTAGILICISFMHIDSYFLGGRYPLWFASGKGRTLYIPTPPPLNFMQGFLFCALHGSCFESDNDSCSNVFAQNQKVWHVLQAPKGIWKPPPQASKICYEH
jgi:hypothetical protein